MKLSIASVAVAAMLASATDLVADDRCPVDSPDLAVIGKAIDDAPTCDAALKMFRTCSTGASGDVALAAVVTAKCEALFAGKLSARQVRAYRRSKQACETKYAAESGTMYRSFEAFCAAQNAHATARPFFGK